MVIIGPATYFACVATLLCETLMPENRPLTINYKGTM